MVENREVKSTNKLCFGLLKTRKEELLGLVADYESYYDPFIQTKTRTDGTTKSRDIEPSYGYLKNVQRKIDRRILKPILDDLPFEIMGGRKGKSVIGNAAHHQDSEAVMKYDVTKFFPSITDEQIYEIFRYRLGFCEEAANILKFLTAYQGHLPQGAPTSTSLAIFAIEPTCRRLKKYCDENGLKFSIWVDDITISGPEELLRKSRGAIRNLLDGAPYTINPDKDTGILTKGAKMSRSVTGILIDNDGRMTIGRKKLRDIRKRVYHRKQYNKKLHGKLIFLKQVNQKQAAKLLWQYGQNQRLVSEK